MADIIVAKTAGFCFGVNRAVKIAFDVADRNHGGCTLGPIIHNKEMVAALNDRGVVSVDSLEDIQGLEPVIIRSHGVKRSVYDKLNEMGVEYIDATCPSRGMKIIPRFRASSRIVSAVIIFSKTLRI